MKILVIGGGPAGHVAAVKAADLGADVTIVEKFRLGGTCLHVGCIPTKILLHASDMLDELKHVDAMGLSVQGASLDFAKLQAYKRNLVNQICGGVGGVMDGRNVKVVYGTATLTGTNSAKVILNDGGETEMNFDKAIIASGSKIASIPVPGADAECVITSDDALAFEKVPESMAIIGGGVIGIEFAALYNRLGTKITIIEAQDTILPPIDREMSGLAKEQLIKDGVDILVNTCVQSIENTATGGLVKVKTADGETQIEAQKILMACGRKPFTEGLGLESAGIETERGAIIVDDYLTTNQPNIYALGDCTGGMMLAHVAQAQALKLGENIVNGNTKAFDGKTTPSCVYLEPELASVGLTETKARELYSNVLIGKWDLAGNAKVMAMGKSGLIKFVVDGDSGEVLGLHIFGPRASDMIHEGALAIGTGATIEDIGNVIHAHPSIGESIMEAAHDVHGEAIYKVYERFSFKDEHTA
jgi:dihydrolipoamide dehydrogenase